MSLSATEPVQRAIDRTRALLFLFDLSKWMVLGFAWFLASLGEGGGRFSGNFPNGAGGSGSGSKGPCPTMVSDAITWIHANLSLVIVMSVVGFLLLVALGLLVVWVSCRGKFVFLDGVVTGSDGDW